MDGGRLGKGVTGRWTRMAGGGGMGCELVVVVCSWARRDTASDKKRPATKVPLNVI